MGWIVVFVSLSGRVMVKCWARIVPNPSFDVSVIRMKGVPLNLSAQRTGSSSRICFSWVNT